MIPKTYNDIIAIKKCCSIEKNYLIKDDKTFKEMYDLIRKNPNNYIIGNRTKLKICDEDGQVLRTYETKTRNDKLNTIKITTKMTTINKYFL